MKNVNIKIPFSGKTTGDRKNVAIQNCLVQKDPQISSEIVSDKTYIFHFDFEK